MQKGLVMELLAWLVFLVPFQKPQTVRKGHKRETLFSRYASVYERMLVDLKKIIIIKKKSSLKEKKHFKMDFCCSFTHEFFFYFWRHIESNVVSIT